MAFIDQAGDAAALIFENLGAAATLIRDAVSTPVTVVMHKDAQSFAAGMESFVTETRTEISFLDAEVDSVMEGDEVQVGGDSYLVKTRVFSDGVVNRWEVRAQ